MGLSEVCVLDCVWLCCICVISVTHAQIDWVNVAACVHYVLKTLINYHCEFALINAQIDWVYVMASQCHRRSYRKLSFVPCVTAHMQRMSDWVLLAPPSILMYFYILCCWMKLRRKHILHSCWKKRKQRCVLVWWPPARGCSSPAKNCLWCHQKMMTSSLGLLELRKDVNKGQNQI